VAVYQASFHRDHSVDRVRWCNVDGQNVACFDVECHLRRVLLGKTLTTHVIYVALYDVFPHKCDLRRIAIRPNVYVALL
jgi:hypothetical protein